MTAAFTITDRETLRTVYVGLHDCREDAWQIYLGYPSADELGKAKMKFVCSEVVMFPIDQRCRT